MSGPRTHFLSLTCPILAFVCLANVLDSLRFAMRCVEARDLWGGRSPPNTSSFMVSLIGCFPPVGQWIAQRSSEQHTEMQLCSRLCCKMLLSLKVKQFWKTKGKKTSRQEWEMLRFWHWNWQRGTRTLATGGRRRTHGAAGKLHAPCAGLLLKCPSQQHGPRVLYCNQAWSCQCSRGSAIPWLPTPTTPCQIRLCCSAQSPPVLHQPPHGFSPLLSIPHAPELSTALRLIAQKLLGSPFLSL